MRHIRELRQRASELLRPVEAGETIEITDRGRPVAVLAPLPDQRPIDRLRATGDLVPAQADLKDLPRAVRFGPAGVRYLCRPPRDCGSRPRAPGDPTGLTAEPADDPTTRHPRRASAKQGHE